MSSPPTPSDPHPLAAEDRVGLRRRRCAALRRRASDPSGPHRNAILAITADHHPVDPQSDVRTTSWNKVFRTQFWHESDLHFTPGVTYEDIPVMIAAHVRATSVDVLKAPVYWWRRRIDSDASITQRRFEIGNLRDRMDAIDGAEQLLHGEERSSGSTTARC